MPSVAARDLLERRVRRADEAGTEQEVLGRVARDGELGEDDEVGAALGARSRSSRISAVAVEVADDHVQLCERDSQGFRLTVINRV